MSDFAAGICTQAIHGGPGPDPATGAIVAPIYQSTTYRQRAVGEDLGHTYSRASNPTVSALEQALGALEDAPPAVGYATGMAAVTGLFLTLLRGGGTGDHVVVSDVVYGGTVRLCHEVLAGLGIEATFVDTSDIAAVSRAITPRTRLIFIETPGNPTLKLTDVRAVAEVAKAAGVRLAVDNTFLTAALLRPLELGADISLYSTTKYIEGHNATVGGAIVTHDGELLERLRRVRKTVGSIQSPMDAWLTLRGLKTLPLRIRRQSESAQRIARWLEGRAEIERVLYPGLDSFAQAELARRQHSETARGEGGPWHGGIVAFEVRGGVAAATAVMNALKLCSLAENLGAAETLVTHPVTMTHGDVPREQRIAAGITDGLIRLSVGLEEPEDIIRDLEQALAGVGAAVGAGGGAAREGKVCDGEVRSTVAAATNNSTNISGSAGNAASFNSPVAGVEQAATRAAGAKGGAPCAVKP